MEIDKNLIIINGDIFEHLAPETMCPAWLYEEMARADTLVCGSKTVAENMFHVLETEAERRLNDDFKSRALATCCLFPSSVGQSNRSLQGILQRLTFAGC